MNFNLKNTNVFETNPSATGRSIYRVILCQRKYFAEFVFNSKNLFTEIVYLFSIYFL
jgi:hypothetical protein